MLTWCAQWWRRRSALRQLPASIAAVVLDFDGVFTDNRVLVGQDGQEAVFCDRGDGLGLERLVALGIPTLVLSGERNPVVESRSRKLGVECQYGVKDKRPALEAWLAARNLAPAQTVYVGNDLNDIDCLRWVGCGVVVADAYPEAKAVARFTLSRRGGTGAIRELADLIMARQPSRPSSFDGS